MAYYSIVKLRLAFVMRKLLREQEQRTAFIITITDRVLLPIRGCPQTTDFATTASAILDKVAPLTQHVLYYRNKHGNATLKDCN